MSVLPHPTRQVRVIGFDDAPFAKRGSAQDAPVQIAGVVCSGTRFEGMVWDRVTRDGFDATDVIAARLLGGKFLPQVHAILFDGVTVGGLNIINIAELSERLSKPCITVMRKMPDLEAFRHVIRLATGTSAATRGARGGRRDRRARAVLLSGSGNRTG